MLQLHKSLRSVYNRGRARRHAGERSRSRQHFVKCAFRTTTGWTSSAAGGVRSNRPAVVGPMQKRLPLPLPAGEVARLAMALNLAHVAAHRLPAFDLPGILARDTAAHIIAAVPLKPAARVVGINPSLLAPDRQRLAGIDTKIIQRAIAVLFGKLGGCLLYTSPSPRD